MTSPRDADIPLPEPIAKHPDARPAREDRSYIVYVASALLMGLGGGLILALVVSFTLSGDINPSAGSARLTQGHGWAQLQGWVGLFVAGMALRLVPRFAGRPPLPAAVNVAMFVPLLVGAVGRTVAQSHDPGETAGILFLVSNLLAAAGTTAVTATLFVTLALSRRRPEAWRYLAWAGTLWWAAWAAILVWTAFEGRHDALVPPSIDEPTTWLVMLGALGNFVWAVQARSVPIFFGRRPPGLRRIALPAAAYNGGAALILVALLLHHEAPSVRLTATGLLLAAAGLVSLAPLAGACWGRPVRLRPRARAAARFVLLADVAAVVAGALLATHAVATLVEGSLEFTGFRDGARHALGLGIFTALVFGMAQLIAPVFALERAERTAPGLLDHLAFGTITAALVVRIAAGILEDPIDIEPRMHLAALAGALAWVALAAFALSVVRAVRSEPAMRALLEKRVRSTNS